MEAIAHRAGVAVQNVYFTFHTKDALLQEVHNRTVLGNDALPRRCSRGTGPPRPNPMWHKR